MSRGLDDLDRRLYKSPPIVKAVFQVVLSWTSDELLEVANRFYEEAEKHFKLVEKLTQNDVRIEPGPVGLRQTIVQSPAGLKCSSSAYTHTVVEPAGVRSIWQGDSGNYPGRAALLNGVVWWIDKIAERLPSTRAVRVSAMMENLIRPVESGLYRIEDYLVPRFELGDAEMLEDFVAFEHRLQLDLSKLAGFPMRGVVVMQTAPDNQDSSRSVIQVVIDVLDERESPLDQVAARLGCVKDVETHVFENSITERAKERYGPAR